MAPVLVCKPADESSAGAIGQEPNGRGHREDLTRRDTRRRDDGKRINARCDHSTYKAAAGPTGKGEQRHRDVEEVSKAQPWHLEDNESYEHRSIERNRRGDEQASLEGYRGHQEDIRPGVPASRPSKE